MEHFDDQNVHFCTCFQAMNSVVGKKIRKVAKGDLTSEIILALIRIKQNPLKAWA